jgi:putative flippase GtrA
VKSTTGVRLRPVLPSGQFLRYLLLGAWNTSFGYFLYAAFTWILSRHLAHGYIYAAILANFFAINVAFLGYKWFVFRTRGNYLREWLRCFAVYGTAALPNLLLLPVVVNLLIVVFHVPPGPSAGHLSHLPLSADRSTFLTAPYLGGALLTVITVVFSFFGHKHFSFRQRSVASADEADEPNNPVKAG